ncbi:hypothetical protein HID58_081610, partial [Brassica napus]
TSEHSNEANIVITRGIGCWHGFSFAGSRQLSISRKLKELKPIIRSFAKENFSNLEKRVEEAFESLTLCQQLTLTAPSHSAAIAEQEAHRKWLVLATAKDSFLRQRPRIQWTAFGDANIAFYHWSIRTRRDQNQIDFFIDSNDAIIDSLEGIKAHVVSYFSSLLASGGMSGCHTVSSLNTLVLMELCSPSSFHRQLMDGWLLRGARSPSAETLQIYLITVPLPSLISEKDSYVW